MTPSSNMIFRISQSGYHKLTIFFIFKKKYSLYHVISVVQDIKADGNSSKCWLKVKGNQHPNHVFMAGLNLVQHPFSETFNIT